MTASYPDRRLMRFYLDDSARAAHERHARPVRNAWPADAAAVGIPYWSHDHAAWCYTMWSSTFEVSPTSVPVPVGNAPVYGADDVSPRPINPVGPATIAGHAAPEYPQP